MTIRMSSALKGQLRQRATETRRSTSFLATEAVSAYVKRELEIIEGIKQALADVEAGHIIPP